MSELHRSKPHYRDLVENYIILGSSFIFGTFFLFLVNVSTFKPPYVILACGAYALFGIHGVHTLKNGTKK